MICAEINLWSNPDQFMVEEDHFMVELTPWNVDTNFLIFAYYGGNQGQTM
jgi:hypothetical protein